MNYVMTTIFQNMCALYMPELICFLESSIQHYCIPKYCWLFNAFCNPIYGCQLWCHFRKNSFNHLRVALMHFRLLNVYGAVLVNCLLNMVLILFPLWFVSNSVPYCCRRLTGRIWFLNVFLNLIDFYCLR